MNASEWILFGLLVFLFTASAGAAISIWLLRVLITVKIAWFIVRAPWRLWDVLEEED